MNRRTFLAASAAAMASTAFGQEPAAAPKKRSLKKAVNLGMVKSPGSTLDKFKMIQDAGFDGVELNRPDALPLVDLLKEKSTNGLSVANVIFSTHWGKPITHQDPAVREQGLHGLK